MGGDVVIEHPGRASGRISHHPWRESGMSGGRASSFDIPPLTPLARHHLTCRRGNPAPLEYTFPSGPLTKLLLTHIKQGHEIITQAKGDKMVRLFVTSKGNAFKDPSNFTQYWENLMRQVDTKGQAYFPPSLARTMFVEEYTGAHGAEPDYWDGCAAIMGNTPSQWRASYNPSRKRRAASQAVAAYHARRFPCPEESEAAEEQDV